MINNGSSTSRILILGIGNWLMGDEGLGVHFAQDMQKRALPGIDVIDGGTGGFHLMEHLEKYPVVILIDAVMDDRLPGVIQLIEPRFAVDFPRAMSTHDIGLKDLFLGLQVLNKMPKIYVFTVSISKLQNMCMDLSPEIKTVFPLLEKKVLRLCEELIQTISYDSSP